MQNFLPTAPQFVQSYTFSTYIIKEGTKVNILYKSIYFNKKRAPANFFLSFRTKLIKYL